MERKNVLVPEADLAVQRDFQKKIKDMFAAREAHPVACVDTFGCQQNVADGQKLMGMLEECGFTFTDKPADADLVILNTCAVREHAEDRVFGNLGALTHAKKENPEMVICLCGCMAQEQRVSERIKKSYPLVNLVFGPHALWRPGSPSCTAATTSARTASCPTSAGGSAAVTRSAFCRK